MKQYKGVLRVLSSTELTDENISYRGYTVNISPSGERMYSSLVKISNERGLTDSFFMDVRGRNFMIASSVNPNVLKNDILALYPKARIRFHDRFLSSVLRQSLHEYMVFMKETKSYWAINGSCVREIGKEVGITELKDALKSFDSASLYSSDEVKQEALKLKKIMGKSLNNVQTLTTIA